jgi:hypothetical protein
MLQFVQIAALSEIQCDPVAAFPFGQVQTLAWQATPLRVQPVLQLAHFARWFEVQLAPDAAIPLEQVQTLAWHPKEEA